MIALCALPEDDYFLMHKERVVKGLTLEKLLCNNTKSVVYKAKLQTDVPVICKIYKNNASSWNNHLQEKTALKKLQDFKVFGVLTIVGEYESEDGEKVLCLSPICDLIRPAVKTGKRAGGKHFAQLVRTVQNMHSAGVIHRDIKPSNLFLNPADNSIILGDMDAAVIPTHQNQRFLWVGTEGYSCSIPVGSIFHIPLPKDDLIAVVRSVYALLTMDTPDENHKIGDEYWSARMPVTSIWGRFLELAKDVKYEELAHELERLIGDFM